MYIVELTRFFTVAVHDERIDSNHISLYMALFQQWNLNNFQNPVSITRKEILQASKLTRTIYHRCMKELHEYGYIQYVPSYHPILGSLVYFPVCSLKSSQPCITSSCTKQRNTSSSK
jgi:hypothetical protein